MIAVPAVETLVQLSIYKACVVCFLLVILYAFYYLYLDLESVIKV